MTSHHPAPEGHKITRPALWGILATGPLSWLGQMTVCTALLSWACYPKRLPLTVPVDGFDWTDDAALVVLILCAAVAALAAFYAWRLLQEVKDEKPGDHADLMEVGHGRTRFVALWGVILSTGFAIATILTLAGFALVPRCAH